MNIICQIHMYIRKYIIICIYIYIEPCKIKSIHSKQKDNMYILLHYTFHLYPFFRRKIYHIYLNLYYSTLNLNPCKYQFSTRLMAMAFVQLCHHFIILRIELVAAWGDEGHPGRIDGYNVTTDP